MSTWQVIAFSFRSKASLMVGGSKGTSISFEKPKSAYVFIPPLVAIMKVGDSTFGLN